MGLVPKIIKSSKFEDGTFTIKAPPLFPPGLGEQPAAEEEAAEPGVDPRVAAAEAEAEAILAQAHEAAEAVLQRAHEEAAQLRQAAIEEGRRAGHDEGHAAGTAEGQQLALSEEAARIAQLAEAIAAFDREREAREEAHAQDLAKLAIVIAQKVLAVELGHGREAAVAMARAALKHITDKTQVRVRVHPLDLEGMQIARSQLLLSVDGLNQLDFVADPGVGLGGCLVETRAGLVDARLSTQLAEIAAAMLDARAGVEEGAELDPVVAAAIRALGRHVAPQPVEAHHPVQVREQAPRVKLPARQAKPEPDPAAEAAAKAQAMLEAAKAEAEAMLAAAKAQAEAAAEATRVVPQAPAVAAEAPTPALTGIPAHEGRGEEAPGPEDLPPPPAGEGAPQGREGGASPNAPDPSKRAAQALAARLGQLKAGRAVLSMEEELAHKQFNEGLKDAELEAIIKQANMPKTDVGLDQALVWTPPKLEDAADDLAARLGQKTRQRKDLPEGALGDDTIDRILDGVGVRAAGEEGLVPPSEPEPEPDLEKATDNLAKMLGVKRKKSNRAWYDQV